MTSDSASVGTVYLVGAGPGDPELMTVKGLRLLQRADVIVYDRLIALELLAEARPDAERIDVGKTPYKPSITQEEINAILVSRALAGSNIVRLKGGDPFVFGRGGEEALACSAAGVPFEVIPGISSAIAAPAYAGIPVTHRNISAAFTVFTGHEDPTKPDTQVDYEALARVGTLVLMMGSGKLAGIIQRLIEAGMSPHTPAAAIEWGSTEHQRVVEGTVSTLPELAIAAGLETPVTTVIGAVAALPEAGLRWFQQHKSSIRGANE